MYKRYFGQYVGDCKIQKSVRMDIETFEIINSISGSGFSDKLRRLAHEYRYMKEKQKPGKSNTF